VRGEGEREGGWMLHFRGKSGAAVSVAGKRGLGIGEGRRGRQVV
jgi:hypothetical protein